MALLSPASFHKLIFSTSVLLVIVGILVSGSLLPGVSLVDKADGDSLLGADHTQTNVTVVQPPPDPFVFERTGDRYQARLSPVVLEATTGRGSLLIIYRMEIPALGYAHETLRTVDEPLSNQRLRLTKPNVTITADSVNRTSYAGRVILSVNTPSSARVIYRSNMTVQFRS